MVTSGAGVLVRAEVASASELILVVEGVRSPELLETVVSKLQGVCGIGDSIRRQLSSADRCKLEAQYYAQLDLSLRASGPTNGGLPFSWVPLPCWVTAALPGFGGADLAEPLPPLWLPKGLMPYQLVGVRRAAVQGGRILLADEMGLGKTAQALTIMAQYLDQEGPALVVTPSSIGGVWKEQALHWMPQLHASEVQLVRGLQDRPLPQARIVIVSYALFAREPKSFSRTSQGEPWQIVACDEAHYLRNPSSQRCKSLMPMLQSARRCLLVTGTPAPKQASEAFSLLHALRPLGCTFQEWSARYGAKRTEHREAEVAALLSEVMVRRMKADVLDQLPPKHRQRILLQLPASKAGALKKLQADALSDDEHFKQLARVKEAAAQDYTEYLIDASGQKFLLFAHHISMLDALEKTLNKREVDCIRIDGSTPVAERLGLVRRFQADPSCRVAVLAVLAAGEGLTLTAASLCVFCELCPAVPGVIEQAEARVHRLGQKAADVDVHFLVVDGTRDDRVFQRLEARSGEVARAIGDSVIDSAEPGLPTNLVAAFDGISTSSSLPKAGARRPPTRRPSHASGESACEPPKKRRKPALSLESVLDAGIDRLQAELLESSPAGSAAGTTTPAELPKVRPEDDEDKPLTMLAAKTFTAPQEEDDMDVALSFFTLQARMSSAVTASRTEDAGSFKKKK